MSLALLFGICFQLGLFSFGGGYTMFSLLEDTFVTKLGALSHESFASGVGLSFLAPGPVAKVALFVGYSAAGWGGALVAMLACFGGSNACDYRHLAFFADRRSPCRSVGPAWHRRRSRGSSVRRRLPALQGPDARPLARVASLGGDSPHDGHRDYPLQSGAPAHHPRLRRRRRADNAGAVGLKATAEWHL